MLEIRKLSVKVKDTEQEILHDFSLTISEGEVHAIMGPNGTGKSTLSKALLGHYKYEITSGEIIFNGVKLNSLDVNERAKLGIFLAMQDPISVSGVTNSEFLKTAVEEVSGEHINYFDFIQKIERSMKELSLDSSMIHRHLNQGFSGGEKKKNEILQLKMLQPKLIILDEIDSGLDVDSLRIVCENITSYFKENPNTSFLIITHYPRILEYIKPDFVHIMKDGKIKKTGDLQLALDTEKNGYLSVNEVRE